VLTKADDCGWQKSLERSAGALDFWALLKEIQRCEERRAFEGEPDNEARQRLLHWVPRGSLPASDVVAGTLEYYYMDHLEFPSPYVEEQYARLLLREDCDKLHRFLHTAETRPSFAGFRGALYARAIAIPRMQSGGAEPLELAELAAPSDAACRRARGLTGAALGLHAPLPLHYFQDVAQLAAAWEGGGDGVFVPSSRLFPAVDLVLRLDGQPVLLNASIGLNPVINVANTRIPELLEALGLGDEAAEVPFVWVLPEVEFAACTGGRPVRVPGPFSGTLWRAVDRRLAQYKLRLPVSEASSAAATPPVGSVIGAAAGGAGTGGSSDGAGAGAVADAVLAGSSEPLPAKRPRVEPSSS